MMGQTTNGKIRKCENQLWESISVVEKSRKILTLLFRQKRRKLKKILERSKNRDALIKYYHKRIDQLTLEEVIDILENFTL